MNTALKRRSFFLSVVLTLLFWATDAVGGFPSSGVVGTYEHVKGKAWLKLYGQNELEYERGDQRLIAEIDFEKQEIRELARSRGVANFAVSHDRRYLAYFDETNLKIMLVRDAEVVLELQIGSGGIQWAKGPNILAVHSASGDGSIYEINVDSGGVKKTPYRGQVLHMAWSEGCDCFIFEGFPYVEYEGEGRISYSLRERFRIENGELIPHEDAKVLTMSPDGKYYYRREEGDGNVFRLYEFSTDRLIGSYGAMSLPKEGKVLWGGSRLGILWDGTRFDLKTGDFVSPSNRYWREEELRPRWKKVDLYDVAADFSDYILKWNLEAEQFEVEDVNTGKTVNVYKKFW